MIPVSTFMARNLSGRRDHDRACHTRAVWSIHGRLDRRAGSDIELGRAAAGVRPHAGRRRTHLSPSSMGTFTSCPLVVPLLLPGAAARSRRRAPASKGTLVHLALQHLMWRPAAERTIEAALEDLARARGRARGRRRVRRARAHRRGVGRRSTPMPRSLVRRYFEIEDPRTVRVLGVELRVAATTERRRDHPRHHRPARARRRRRARRHRLQDRLGAERGLGAAEHGGRARLLAAVRADVRPPPGTGAAAVPVEPGEDRDPRHRPVAARRRGEVERGDARDPRRVHAPRLPAARLGAVRVLLVPRVLPRVRWRSEHTRHPCCRPGRPSAKAGRSCRSSIV